MTMRILRLLAATAALAAIPALAELPAVRGEPALAPKAVVPARLRMPAEKVQATRAQLPQVSEAELEALRAANRSRSSSALRMGTHRVFVGIARPALGEQATTAAQMRWVAVAGGHAARVALGSPGAASLRLAIDLAGVPEDVEMVFFGSAVPDRLEGPVRVATIRDRTRPWWSPLTEGATQTVEFFVPARHDPRVLALGVSGVSHLFTSPSSRMTKRLIDIGDAGACNVDITCSPLAGSATFRNTAESVAQMVYNLDGLTALCSGSLLADSDAATQVPWFYGANHCFENGDPPYKNPAQMQAVANTLTTLWRFEASSCNSGQPNPAWTQVGGGATVLHSNVETDVLFMQLNAAPPAGAFYSGWDANPIGGGNGVVAIHHPEGDLKKVSRGSVQGLFTPGVGGGGASFIEVLWNSGTTEPGSSGSGLWTTNGTDYFFRGGLFGGTAECALPQETDFYSRFDRAYPLLTRFLSMPAPAADFTDLWWNPNESGWGLNLVQHPSRVIFGVWYTYEPDGTRTWYVIPTGNWSTSTTYTGPLFTTSGPPFNAATFDAALVQSRQVGTATLTFSDANNGSFAYSVDGVSGTKTMTRQSF